MQIESLSVTHFRNYAEQIVSFDPKCNVIYGENAQGKTNLLEAMVYLSCGKSPRTRFDRELIQFGADFAKLEATVQARERLFQMEAVLFLGKRRKLQVNRVPAKTASSLSEVYQTVFFCPEDLQLIREGPGARRRFLDTALCQLRPRYDAALSQYHRLYEHKTRILRDSGQKKELLSMLPDFNAQMIHFGAILIHYRAHFINRLAELAAGHHFECSGGKERLLLQYATVSTIGNPMASLEELEQKLSIHMLEHQKAELATGFCLSGPHKDDMLVDINEKSAKSFSSQGQTRTAALSIKLAERALYEHTTGEYPILLLDDVLSELDPRRQEFVLNRIQDGQLFITCCEDDRLASLLDGKVFHVEQGKVID